jgi:hypothetical protein
VPIFIFFKRDLTEVKSYHAITDLLYLNAKEEQPMMLDEEIEAVKQRILELTIEHRDLDDVIDRLSLDVVIDQLQLRRLKKRKLIIKDEIVLLQQQLIPDILA